MFSDMKNNNQPSSESQHTVPENPAWLSHRTKVKNVVRSVRQTDLVISPKLQYIGIVWDAVRVASEDGLVSMAVLLGVYDPF